MKPNQEPETRAGLVAEPLLGGWWSISYMPPLVNGTGMTATLWAPTDGWVPEMVRIAIRDGAKEITITRDAQWVPDNVTLYVAHPPQGETSS